MVDLTQTEWVRRARAGERDAFDRLVGRHLGGLRGFLATRVPEDQVEDLIQETLMRALIGLADLQDPEQFRSWLIGIAGNLVRMNYRSQRIRSSVLDEYETSTRTAIDVSAESFTPEAIVLASERAEAVSEAVAALPDGSREIVELHYGEGLTYKEIADRLDITVTSIEGRLYRARQRLKEGLKMTQTTTDMFELKEQVEALQDQVGELQKLQQRLAKEDEMSMGAGAVGGGEHDLPAARGGRRADFVGNRRGVPDGEGSQQQADVDLDHEHREVRQPADGRAGGLSRRRVC